MTRPRTPPPTIDDIRARCTDLGDCWLWQGGKSSTGHPMLYGELRRVLVRRYVWQLLGHELPAKPLVLKATCGEVLCCNPKHLAVWTRSQLVAEAYASSRNTDAEYGARFAARVKQGTKIDMQKARAIRADQRTSDAVAAEMGISASMVRKIRSGQCWRELAAGASVFTWRP